ncbi:hypothetical protein A2U01_0022678 [Trifolium medium]|uniref:Uncharacterized protein n=1 Tax=Trifolium medium TaxID=97028 RepID=A0A392NP73_9FABA|nr:hypothetical protein [Trifolium medium]
MEMEWGTYFKSIVVQLDEKTTGYVDLAENKSSALSRADIGRLEESGKFV